MRVINTKSWGNVILTVVFDVPLAALANIVSSVN